jgi:hypothetical protein
MEITFETEETVVLRDGANVSIEYCPDCHRDVLMATPHAVAFLSGLSERHIFRMLESDLLHFSEHARVMVCLESGRSIMEPGEEQQRTHRTADSS